MRRALADDLIRTERDLQERVRVTCRDLAPLGVRFYHTWSSLHSPKGFPDCLILGRDWLIALELKSEKGKATPEQLDWLAAFDGLPNGLGRVVRPADWPAVQDLLIRLATSGPDSGA